MPGLQPSGFFSRPFPGALPLSLYTSRSGHTVYDCVAASIQLFMESPLLASGQHEARGPQGPRFLVTHSGLAVKRMPRAREVPHAHQPLPDRLRAGRPVALATQMAAQLADDADELG